MLAAVPFLGRAQFMSEFKADTVKPGQLLSVKRDTVKRTDSLKPAIVQRPIIRPRVKRPKPISREFSVGAKITSSGWGFYVDRGIVKSSNSKYSDIFYNIKLWQLDFEEIKNPREMKNIVTDQSGGKSSSFIYGKVNNFYSLKLGLGTRYMIAGKPDPHTVSIHWMAIGGLSLGLLKPYYINSTYSGGSTAIKYTDATHDAFLDPASITGSAGFGKGLSETKVIPGLFVKTALHFDFAASKKTILAVETGIKGEIYSQSVLLMAEQKAVPYFFNIYAGFQFGKRW